MADRVDDLQFHDLLRQEPQGPIGKALGRRTQSRANNCYDNAFMESCFGTLKTELEMTEYESVERARGEIGEYVHYYQSERRHSALGYLTPEQFERLGP